MEPIVSNVTMTLPELQLAEHNTHYFHSSTFVEFEGGKVLHTAGNGFTISDDGGITWSQPFNCKDRDGTLVGGNSPSLVKLSGDGIGLAVRKIPPERIRKRRGGT